MTTFNLACLAFVAAFGLLGDPGNQAPGTRTMVERLKRLSREANPIRNPYLNTRRVAYFREVVRNAPDHKAEARRRFLLAHELLQAGESDAAIAELETLQRKIAEYGLEMGPAERRRIRDELAISYLRVAEQENCCAMHNIDSCFVPIRGAGIHTAERGSRGAIRHLTEALTEDPDDLTSRWLLNLAYMTLGEYPDEVPPQWVIPAEAFESEHEIERFYEVAGKLRLDVVGLAGGSIMEDFDGDGNLDIMASSWGLNDQLRFFRNNGDGTFSDHTERAGLTGLVGGLNMKHADYDNDGRPDVLVLRGAWWYEQGRHPNSLLRNTGAPGAPRFEDVTEEAGLLSFHPTQTAAWGDYDNDGWLDLFIGNESTRKSFHPCELYRNNGDGTFSECAAAAGVAYQGYVKGVTFGDYNNDRLPDLYLSVLNGPNVLYRNDGARPPAWGFTDVTAAAGVAEPRRSFPTWFWDYDNDGWLDLLVFGYAWSSVGDVAADYLGLPHDGERVRLYRNRADPDAPGFDDVTGEANLYRLVLAMGSNFGDLDNDGYPDFYAATGEPDYRAVVPNLMFRNDGGRRFQDVTTAGGFGNIQKGHGVAFGDLDNDGDQDLYTVMGGAYSGDVFPNLLFENPGHGNHWVTLKLEGVRTNRAAIGARIRVRVAEEAGERDIHAVVGTGGSFGSSSLQQEIGLGAATSIRFVEITWPVSGEVQVVEDLAMDASYVIREGAEPVPLQRKRFSLSGP